MLPPLAHWDYDDACPCSLCMGYQRAKAAYKAARAGHHRCCYCDLCRERKARFVDYLAAGNQREVYSEVSFTLGFRKDPPHKLAGECLHWLYDRIIDPGYRDEWWWALSGDQREIRSWVEDFQMDWGAQHGLPVQVWAVSGLC